MSDQDLLRYYKVLKQFLDISDDITSSTRSKSNSSRAQRAREKLLKLSSAQFKELSTDVYDELKRRIDESRTEPDFLLPKLTFHPKRNQARQKLSSLPQSRFKDLVSDISFEIERRHLHVSTHSTSTDSTTTTPTHQQWPSQDHSISERGEHARAPSSEFGASSYSQFEGHGQSHAHIQNGQHSADLADGPLLNDLATPKIEPPVQQKTIGVQPTTVVPTKANLAWSSDEEDDVEYEQKKLPEKHSQTVDDLNQDQQEEEVIRRISLSNGFAPPLKSGDDQTTYQLKELKADDHHDESADLHLQLTALKERNQQLESDLNNLQEAHDELLDKHSTVTTANKKLESLLSDIQQQEQQNKARSAEDYSNAINELESLRAVNAAIRLENQALKNSQARGSRSPGSDGPVDARNSRELVNTQPQTEAESAVQPVDINSQLEKLFSKIDSLPQKAVDSSTIIQLQSEATKWQKRYEEAQAGKISSAIQSPLSDSKDIKKYLSPSGEVPLQTASTFFALIDSFVLHLNSETLDNDSLFEKMSKIALVANNVASHGQESAFNNDVHSGFVREAAGHALTATRYFASYRQLLPKVVVERAVAEVAFAVCDFISAFKLIDTTVSEPNDERKDKPMPLKESDGLNKNSISIRPLKIASRLQSNLGSDLLSQPQLKDGEKVAPQEASIGSRSLESPIAPKVEASFSSDLNKEVEPLQGKKSIFERFQTSKLTTKAKEEEKTDIPLSLSREEEKPVAETLTGAKSSPETPKKSSILDRVRKFESPQETKTISPTTPTAANVRSVNLRFPDGQKVEGQVSHDLAEEEKSPIASSSPKSAGSVPTRGKSIFQSLREKFANEKAAKSEENDNTGTRNVSNGSLTNENTAKIATEADSTIDSTVPPVEEKDRPIGDDADSRSVNNVIEDEIEALNIARAPEDASSNDQEPPLNPHTASEMPGAFGAESKLDNESPRTESSSDRDSIYEEATEEETPSQVMEPAFPEDTPKSDVASGQEPSRSLSLGFKGIPVKAPSFRVKKVNYAKTPESESDYDDNDDDEEDDEEDEEEEEARQRQEYRKSMAAATFNFDLFDIDDPDNTLTQVLLYLEHQTVQVITTIQDLLSAIKRPDSTRGELRENSMAISEVIKQMTEATNTSMNQTRNFQLKEHGSWVVKSLEDCNHRMNTLCRANTDRSDLDFADKNFKQRLAGISFDIAKCTKELVKTVEEASLKEDIAHLDARLNHQDDLT